MLALIISNENGDINVVEQLSSLRLKNRNWYSEGKKTLLKNAQNRYSKVQTNNLGKNVSSQSHLELCSFSTIFSSIL